MRAIGAILAAGLGAISLVVGPARAAAQTGGAHSSALPPTGMITGKVYDRQTGQPLIGGMVVLEDTSLGNVTNDDGSFFVSDVPVGSYRVRSEYLGYESATRSINVQAGGTATVDFAMGTDVVQADAIVAVVDKEPIPVKPPEKDYIVASEVQTHIPDEMEQPSCRVSTTVHGSYIIDGRWELTASVGTLLCGDQVIECQPVVVRRLTPQPVATMAEAEAAVAEPASP